MEQTLLLLNNAPQPPASSINNLLNRTVSGDQPLGFNHDSEQYQCVCVCVYVHYWLLATVISRPEKPTKEAF